MKFVSFLSVFCFSLIKPITADAQEVYVNIEQSPSAKSEFTFGPLSTRKKSTPLHDDINNVDTSHSTLLKDKNMQTLSTVLFCGTEIDIFQPSLLSVAPDPPKRGQPLTFIIEGILSKDVVYGAYAQVRVKLGLIQLLDKRFDLCEEVAKLGEKCPFLKGPFRLEKTVDIPGQVPPGRYSASVEAYNVNDESLTCLDAEFRISFL